MVENCATQNISPTIYAKITTGRLVPYMPKLIDLDQLGFISGSKAPNATWKIANLIHYVESTKTPTIFLTLDAEKSL